MSVIFSDDFNRADSTNLGGNWSEASGDSSINTNRLRAGIWAASVPGQALTTTSAHSAIADCKVTITQHKTGSNADGGPIARVATSGSSPKMYTCDVYTGRCELYRHDSSNTGTLLGSGVAITQAADKVIALEVSGTGATVTVKSYYDGVQQESVGDTSANRITSANQTGVYNWRSVSDGDCDYDDFSVDDLAAATASAPKPAQSRPFPFKPGSPPSRNAPYR
jgi:hypothetical protein